MPITPFHFGPGLLLKAAAPRRFSLTAFVAANVVIDVESAYYLFTGGWPVHRVLHTFLLATAVGLLTGYAVHRFGRRLLPRDRPSASDPRLGPALVGGGLGGFTHALMDGIMHSDMNPLRPFAEGNPLLLATSLAALHLFCVVSGALGILWLAYRGSAPSRP